jgi:hypothetical protein
MSPLPVAIVPVLQPFACLFTQPTWRHAHVLLAGTLLAQGPRTVAAALRVMGLGGEQRFERYHRVLNRARWSGCRGAQILLGLLIERLPPEWPIVVAVDETLERRRGARIGAKGLYRDAARSTRRQVVTCLGLQWICLALLVPVPWSERPWALPFLTRLAPSERADQAAGRRHRTTVELTIGMVRQVARWLGRCRWTLLGDGSYSCVALGWECLAAPVSLVTRLRLDARLFAFPAPVPAERRGPKPKQGAALAKLATRAQEARDQGEEVTLHWYGHPKTLRLLSAVCLWHTPGWPPLPIRWVLVADPAGQLPTQAFFTTDLTLAPARVVELFVWRWSLEVTFEEVRRHLGVETQRPWSDLAIARTTPVLMALFSLVCLMVYQWRERWASLPRSSAWYLKSQATFSDCLALVRRTIWAEGNYTNSTPGPAMVLISADRLDRLLDQLAATP